MAHHTTIKLLEVCVDSLESALAAHNGGAHRIELCAALSEGGLTPSLGLFVQVKKMIDTERTKIFVMLRPRRGIDFKYSGGEMEAILFDLGQFKTHGADGFVFGALNTSRNIDVEACCRVVKAAVPLPVTFHRAFDVLDREVLGANVEQLIDLGFKRILTSGCHETAEKGSAVIGGLTEDYGGRIIFLTGGGIEPGNLQRLIDQTKCKEFHGSCRMKGTFERDAIIGDLVKNVPTDEHKVREMINILKQT